MDVEAAVVEQEEIGEGAAGVDADSSPELYPRFFVQSIQRMRFRSGLWIWRLRQLVCRVGCRVSGFLPTIIAVRSMEMDEDARREQPDGGRGGAEENAEEERPIGSSRISGHE